MLSVLELNINIVQVYLDCATIGLDVGGKALLVEAVDEGSEAGEVDGGKGFGDFVFDEVRSCLADVESDCVGGVLSVFVGCLAEDGLAWLSA